MRRRAGFTLAEIALVVAIIGIAAAIAAPRMAAMVAHARTRAAANRVAADLAYVRATAVREGARARLVIEPSADCPRPRVGAAGHRYRLVRTAPGDDTLVSRVDLRSGGGRLCLASNRSSEVVFNSRGLLAAPQNRTLVVRQGTYLPDTLTLSLVGRVLRRY